MLKKILYTAVFGMLLSSCTESVMDNINKDEANPAVGIVTAKFQLPDAIVGTSYSGWSSAYAWYVSSYTEQTFGTGNNQLMKAELRMRTETAASTTFNNEWNAVYANLMNIKQMMDKCAPDGVSHDEVDIVGMGHVLWVLNAELLTDMHGDIPYSEALVESQPKLDKQQDIYTDLLERLDTAIEIFAAAEAAGLDNAGAHDVLYGGDLGKWTALAYAVKARLLLNMSYRDNGACAKAIEAAGKALAAGFEGAAVDVFDGVNTENPWTAYFFSRYYTGANGTVVDLMAERDDPRLGVYACDLFESGVDYAPAGDSPLAKSTNTVGLPYWLMNGAAVMHLMSESELYFILAEAKARTGGDAAADFEAAVRASFADYGAACDMEMEGVDDYLAALGAPTLAEIMVQKYLAQTRDEQLQAYNDLRRCKALGEEHVVMNNPNNMQGGANQWPLRLPYGNSDVISNPNVAAAFGSGNNAGNYLFTENIWLFGGER